MRNLPRSLTFKLIVAFLAVSLGAIALVAVLSWYSATTEFTRFVGQQAQDDFVVFVTDYYNTNGSLTGVDKSIRAQVETLPDPGTDRPRIIPFALATPNGTIINPSEGFGLGEQVSPDLIANGSKILHNGQVVDVVI